MAQAHELDVLAEIPVGEPLAVAGQGDLAYVGLGPRLVVLDLSRGQPQPLGWTPPFGANVSDVALARRVAVVAAGASGLHLVDARVPSRPLVIAQHAFRATRLKARGNLVFAVGSSGLSVVDVSQPAAPVQLSLTPLVGATGLDVSGERAYVAMAQYGLVILDISDPRRPRQLGQLDIPGRASDVAVSGTMAAVAEGENGVLLVDVSDPAAPTPVGAIPPLEDCQFQKCPEAVQLASAGDLLYVVYQRCQTPFDCRTSGGVRAYRVSDPAAPLEVHRVDTQGNPVDLAVSHGRVLVATNHLRWYMGTGPCPLRSGAVSVHGLDLAEAGSWLPLSSAAALAASGDLVFVADPVGGTFRTLDLSDPSRPTFVTTSLPTRTLGQPYGYHAPTDVAVANHLWLLVGPEDAAWTAVASEGGSASDRLRPAMGAGDRDAGDEWRAAGPLNGCSPPPRDKWFRRGRASGDYVYAVDAEGGLQVYHSEEYTPSARLSGSYDELALAEKTLYLIVRHASVQLADISDPRKPVLGAKISLPAVRASAENGWLYVAADEAGLIIVDASNRAAPREVSRSDTPGYALDVAASGGYAYVADGPAGLQVYDVRRPETPVLVANRSLGTDALRLVLTKQAVVVATRHALLALKPPRARPPVPTSSPSPTPTPSPTRSPSPTFSPSPTSSPSATFSPSPTPSPSATSSPSPTFSPSPTRAWPHQVNLPRIEAP